MLFKVVDDWKQNLHPEDEVRLNEILRNVTKHRAAYRTSKDVKTAQLWCALLELKKENKALYNKLARIEYIFEGMTERLLKQRTEDKSILEALEKF
jgi:hypothetical protein